MRVAQLIAGPSLLIASSAFADEGPDAWDASPHADVDSESFTHWNDEGEIPTDCAGCHSTSGFLDRIGTDGTEQSSVEAVAPTGSTVGCETCHADARKRPR